MFRGLLLLVSWYLVPAVFALDWEKTEISKRAEIGASLPVYEFGFTNNTKSAVTISEIRVSCGCLDFDLAKKIYAPGESGKLVVTFDRTGLVGQVSRTVSVTTDEPRKEPYLLELHAELPEAITLAPRVVHWRSGAALQAKTVEIKVGVPDGLEITDALSNIDGFDVKLTTVEARQHYRLEITPTDTSSKRMAIITLQISGNVPSGTATTVYAQVR